jgi:hypothetical protein
MHKKITSPEDRGAPPPDSGPDCRGSTEGQAKPTELAMDTATNAANNRFPGDDGNTASAWGVVNVSIIQTNNISTTRRFGRLIPSVDYVVWSGAVGPETSIASL